jgi:branched-subunit amino acid aminotransferase/4-amino-4-deoxychorismate lyase
MSEVWINGQFVDESAASISLRDTGLLHAAGVFTTMRSYGGKVFRLSEHLKRLRNSCEALFIPLQYKDQTLVDAAAELLVAKSVDRRAAAPHRDSRRRFAGSAERNQHPADDVPHRRPTGSHIRPSFTRRA